MEGNAVTLTVPDIVLAWLEQERAMLHQQIELFESGTCGTHYREEGRTVDTTKHSIGDLKAKQAALESLLAEVKRTEEEET
jgi:hypothetical protein